MMKTGVYFVVFVFTLVTCSPFYTFFHLTDIHLDPLYNPKASVQTLCRGSSTIVYGKFGKYGCDSPTTLLQSALAAMKEIEPNPTFILIGGDLALHTPPDGNVTLNSTSLVIHTLQTYFPETPLILTVGNNDVFPHYSAKTPMGPWLTHLASTWSPTFPDNQSLSDFTNFGYYHVTLTPNNNNNTPPLEIISLNSVLFSPNYMPYPSPESRQSQHFDWLKEKLTEFRAQGHVAFLLGHLPPASVQYNNEIEWHKEYIATFYDIVVQFKDVVLGNFFSHTHRDEWKIYSHNGVSIGLLCTGSLSPVSQTNPRFRLVFANSTTNNLIDYVDYYTDLIVSYNSDSDLNWNLEYDFDQAYNEGRVDGDSMLDVFRRLQNSSSLFEDWLARYVGMFDVSKEQYLCAMAYPIREDFENCISHIVPAAL